MACSIRVRQCFGVTGLKWKLWSRDDRLLGSMATFFDQDVCRRQDLLVHMIKDAPMVLEWVTQV